MKAMILAAGLCKRLRPLTENIHKSLLELNPPETILSRQLNILRKSGIRDVVIVCGHGKKFIRDFILRDVWSDMNIILMENVEYASTNYITSFVLGSKEVKDERLILFHGDLVFDPRLLSEMMADKRQNLVYVSSLESPNRRKDFKAKVMRGRVLEISTRKILKTQYACQPLYCISNTLFKAWVKQAIFFLKEDKKNVYAEEALNTILHAFLLHPFQSDFFCFEVDDIRDLLKAKKLCSL